MIGLNIKIDDNGDSSCKVTGELQVIDLVEVYFTLQSLGNEVKEQFLNECQKGGHSKEDSEKAFNKLLTKFYYRKIE